MLLRPTFTFIPPALPSPAERPVFTLRAEPNHDSRVSLRRRMRRSGVSDWCAF